MAGGLWPVGGGAGGGLRAAVVEAWLFKERRGGCSPSGPERPLHSERFLVVWATPTAACAATGS